jgi:peroxiredoxin family protein
MTNVVFSNDLDKAMAALIIANGAAAAGYKVTLFFTFWGLALLRKEDGAPVKKNIVEKMFGMMLPKGVDGAKLSKMHMGGMGTAMMHKVMADKNVSSLKELLEQTIENGIRLVACSMSMDVMGIKEEELIDGVEIGGVAMYINELSQGTSGLFI